MTTLEGKIVVIGGMNEEREIVRDVHTFDPSSGAWQSIAAFPGQGMNGFGVAACNVGGVVYASGSDGTLYRLGAISDSWRPVAQLSQPRFFHRLAAKDEVTLLAIAGASRKRHLSDIEVLALHSPAAQPSDSPHFP
jgi:hypothetical protein